MNKTVCVILRLCQVKKARWKIVFDDNTRAGIACREIVKGHTATEAFCVYINIPQPIKVTTYSRCVYRSYMHSPTFQVSRIIRETLGLENLCKNMHTVNPLLK